MEIADRYYDEMDAQHRRASTIASAIEINRPVNLTKCLRALEWCNGVVREVTDQEILDAKAQVGAGGLGCEPASAASVAGVKKLVAEGVIGPDERVVCILTGHQLKDPTATVAYHSADQKKFDEVLGSRGVHPATFANHAVAVPNDLDEIIKASSRTVRDCEIAADWRIAMSHLPLRTTHATSHRHSRSRRTHGTTTGRPGRGRSRTFRRRGRSIRRHPRLGEDAGVVAGVKAIGVPLSASLDAAVDVVIDFSLPAAAEKIIEICRQRQIPLVVATTGLDETQTKKLRAAAHEIPLLWSPNMSLAVNLTMKLAEVAATALEGPRRRRGNPRTPSPLQGRRAQRHGLEVRPDHRRRDGPDRPSPRPRGPARQTPARRNRLPRHPRRRQSRRAHDHLRHVGRNDRADGPRHNRDCYAAGALAAAKFLVGKKPGLYGMNDVLGL